MPRTYLTANTVYARVAVTGKILYSGYVAPNIAVTVGGPATVIKAGSTITED